MRRWKFLLLLFVFVAPGLPKTTAAGGDELVAVSMVQLMIGPGPYVGRQIQVVGYLGIDGALYLTKDHAAVGDAMSSILVSDTDEGEIAAAGCLESYVRLRGRLKESRPHSFIIVDVEQVFFPDRGKVCWSLQPS